VGTRYYIEGTKYFVSRMALISHRIVSSPGQRPCELLPSLVVRPSYVVNFHI